MLAYWDPFADIARIQDKVFGRGGLERDYTFKPAVDILEDEDGIHVKADVAGLKPEDIKVNVENNVLSISGERKLEQEDKRDSYHRVERFHGSFSRSFALPDEVDSENVGAKYENGVLTVTLHKRPAAKRKEITVQAS